MKQIIAAVRDESLKKALESNVDVIFHLAPNVMTLSEKIDLVHKSGKRLFVHMDMAEGLGKDKFGIKYIKSLGVDGIISTRGNIIKTAKEEGLITVQRFFVIDSHSIETIIENTKSVKPDMMEIMPGIVPKVISRLDKRVGVPIIAGGIVETEEEFNTLIKSGALAISTSNMSLWNVKL